MVQVATAAVLAMVLPWPLEGHPWAEDPGWGGDLDGGPATGRLPAPWRLLRLIGAPARSADAREHVCSMAKSVLLMLIREKLRARSIV